MKGLDQLKEIEGISQGQLKSIEGIETDQLKEIEEIDRGLLKSIEGRETDQLKKLEGIDQSHLKETEKIKTDPLKGREIEMNCTVGNTLREISQNQVMKIMKENKKTGHMKKKVPDQKLGGDRREVRIQVTNTLKHYELKLIFSKFFDCEKSGLKKDNLVGRV